MVLFQISDFDNRILDFLLETVPAVLFMGLAHATGSAGGR